MNVYSGARAAEVASNGTLPSTRIPSGGAKEFWQQYVSQRRPCLLRPRRTEDETTPEVAELASLVDKLRDDSILMEVAGNEHVHVEVRGSNLKNLVEG